MLCFFLLPALTGVCTKFKSGVCKTAGECITPRFYSRSQDRRFRGPSSNRHICRPNLFSPPAAGVLAAGTPARTPDHARGRRGGSEGQRRYKSYANCRVNRNGTIKLCFETTGRREPRFLTVRSPPSPCCPCIRR